MKKYTVGDVINHTGLTRKQLFDYEKSIPPIDRVDNESEYHRGYKLYDEEGLNKLCMAALFSKLGAGSKKINETFSEERYDRKKILNELINDAKKERQKLTDIITVAEMMMDLDYSSLLVNPLKIRDLHKTAVAIRRELKAEYLVTLQTKLEDTALRKKYNLILKEIAESENQEERSYKAVEKLVRFITNELEISEWARVLTGMWSIYYMEEDVKKEIRKEIKVENLDYIVEAIFSYQGNGFVNDLERYTDELDVLDTKEYDDPKAKKALDLLLSLLRKWFGMRDLAEAIDSLEGIKVVMNLEDDETDFDFKSAIEELYDVLNFYNDKKQDNL